MDLHRRDEAYWQQRGRINWLLKGDALIAYFLHLLMVVVTDALSLACLLKVSWSRIHCQYEPCLHFFSDMLSARHESGFSISSSLWSEGSHVSEAQNKDLMLPLSTEEIGAAVSLFNSNSAPALMVSPLPFSKKLAGP